MIIKTVPEGAAYAARRLGVALRHWARSGSAATVWPTLISRSRPPAGPANRMVNQSGYMISGGFGLTG